MPHWRGKLLAFIFKPTLSYLTFAVKDTAIPLSFHATTIDQMITGHVDTRAYNFDSSHNVS